MQPIQIITKELQATLIDDSNIKEVYFDKTGKHYFNIFELPRGRKEKDLTFDKSLAKFGKGIYSHSEVIKGEWNVDGIKEAINYGDKETEIVSSLTRDEVIEFKVIDENDKSILAQIANAPKEEIAALKEFLSKEAKVEKPVTVKSVPIVEPKK